MSEAEKGRFLFIDEQKEIKKTFSEILAEEMENDSESVEEMNEKLSPKTKKNLMEAFKKYHAEKN